MTSPAAKYGSTGVLYSDLKDAGWGLMKPRIASTVGGFEGSLNPVLSTAGQGELFTAPDFRSVICNQGPGKFVNKYQCQDIGQGPLGAVHIRYDCGADENSGTLWILT
jgi:hypothetical protein